jgi:AmmeMemoRadiSam system protein A
VNTLPRFHPSGAIAPAEDLAHAPAHPLLRLAWLAIREHLDARDPRGLLESLAAPGPPQACFVSLKLGGRLRGCIGTILPAHPSLEAEIVANAVASSQRDPRFPPVTRSELERIDVSVDVLSPPETIASPAQLDARRYGVIVSGAGRMGVLLPDLPGVNTPARQIAICRDKADIPANAPITLQRFTVLRIGA